VRHDFFFFATLSGLLGRPGSSPLIVQQILTYVRPCGDKGFVVDILSQSKHQ